MLYQCMDEIDCMFNEDKVVLVMYNFKDCELVMCIFVKIDIFFFLLECVSVIGLQVDCSGGLVVVFMYLYLLYMYCKGYVVFNFGDVEVLVSLGGFVMDLCVGLYDLVIVLDYKSLYFSIICSFLIDLVGLVDGILNELESEIVFGYNGVCFLCCSYSLLVIIEQIWQGCEVVKVQGNKLLQQVLKIIMNFFYGVLGLIGCCFFDLCLVLFIIWCGYEIMYCMCELIEEVGYEVIYGDIDFIFVWLCWLYGDDEVCQIGLQLIVCINDWWCCYLVGQYQLESVLELQFEVYYQCFLMLYVCGVEIGSKKCYVGYVWISEGEDKVIYKGLEMVCIDWLLLVQCFQQVLYLCIFCGEFYCDFIIGYVVDLLVGWLDDLLVYCKCLC